MRRVLYYKIIFIFEFIECASWHIPTRITMKLKYYKQYRLPEFDYSSDNGYFITVCTKNREHYFGKIENAEMYFTEIGLEVEHLFEKVNNNLDYIKIHHYVVMPNHIHFIAVINNPNHKEQEIVKGIQPLVPKSISSFTNHFKGKIKRWCNENGFENFEWQSRFHDRIIRDKEEYQAIRYYIRNNVSNWEKDKENS